MRYESQYATQEREAIRQMQVAWFRLQSWAWLNGFRIEPFIGPDSFELVHR